MQVTTPTGGTSAITAADHFTYGSTPTVTAVSPAVARTAGGSTITITGTGFTGATQVSFGASLATPTVVNDTTITVVAPAHAAGTVNVLVSTPLGTSADTAADDFVYTDKPVVMSIDPTAGSTAGGTVVTVTGINFTGVTGVTFGGTAVTASNVSDTSLTVTSPAHAAAGSVDILVTTAAGTSDNTAADNFTYGSTPVVTAISPSTGPIAGGTTVTVTGTNFTGATGVLVDGNSVTPSNVTATSLTFVTPAHAQGTVDIQVVTPLGTSATSSADLFTFGAAPTTTYTLYFRWSLIVWNGTNGMSVDAALKGLETPDNSATNDISGSVTAIFRYDNASQRFLGWFPNSSNIPGANDFTTLVKGNAYWFAISTNPSVTWTVLTGS